ncbi:MAG TPA: DUF2087 domain-containing protein [Candidatus Gracilibacteria bacterium]
MENYKDELKYFLNEVGQLISWPAKSKKQKFVYPYLADKIEFDRDYSETEINDLLNTWHTFSDAALLRREFYIKGHLDRKEDGSLYWKTTPTP